MAILEQLQNDLKAALKSGDRLRVETIRMAIDALKKAQMAQVKAAFDAAGGESADTAALAEIDRHAILTEAAEQEVLTKEVKRRREAAELYRKGGADRSCRKGGGGSGDSSGVPAAATFGRRIAPPRQSDHR
ncbi:hypothetical protein [Roseiflexus castenholzii]|uniref:hypothetical protein n=1 Tax=Roseiflexus castenholzii TaxID=120962 RepID=UPI003C7BA384